MCLCSQSVGITPPARYWAPPMLTTPPQPREDASDDASSLTMRVACSLSGPFVRGNRQRKPRSELFPQMRVSVTCQIDPTLVGFDHLGRTATSHASKVTPVGSPQSWSCTCPQRVAAFDKHPSARAVRSMARGLSSIFWRIRNVIVSESQMISKY